MYEKVYENPDIYIIDVPLPNNPLRNLNCYVIKTPEGNLIIDTGFNLEECYSALKEGLEQLEIDIEKTDMFITHLHSDHSGLAAYIMNKDSTIYMSKKDYNYLSNMDDKRWKMLYEFYISEGFSEQEMSILWTVNPAKAYAPDTSFDAVTFSDNFKFSIGDYEFTCIMTPGHTPGHACIYMEHEKILFSGDHILFDISPNITQWVGVKNSLKDYLDSLKKIQRLEIKTTFAGHRKNSMDVYERIEQLLKHHDIRLQETINIVTDHSGLNSYDIASCMKWSMRGKNWSEFPVQQKLFAVGETISHLDYLMEENKVYKKLENGVYKYYLN